MLDSVLFDGMIRVLRRFELGYMGVENGDHGVAPVLFCVVLYSFILWLFMFYVYLIGQVISVRFGRCV